MRPKLLLTLVICLLVVSSFAIYLSRVSTSEANTNLALAEMQITKLTCGSCVEKISTALKEISGVEAVEVSVTTGVGKVTFDPELAVAETLVAKVTDAGYPASLKNLLDRDQYQALKTEESRLAADYVGRIGEQLISRASFSRQFDQYLKTAGLEERPEARLQALQQSWQILLQKSLLLQAADKNQILVLDGEVDLRIDEMRAKMPKFAEYVSFKYGSEENYKRHLKEEMIINRNIEQVVLVNITDSRQRQQKFSQWFQGLVDDAAIVIYDPELKQAASSAGGCCGGGSCSG